MVIFNVVSKSKIKSQIQLLLYQVYIYDINQMKINESLVWPKTIIIKKVKGQLVHSETIGFLTMDFNSHRKKGDTE